MFFLLFKCYTKERVRKGERYTRTVKEKRLGRESLIICTTSKADAEISMARRRNENNGG